MGEEGAINSATDEGHRGAEVLQGSWELFLSSWGVSVSQVKWR